MLYINKRELEAKLYVLAVMYQHTNLARMLRGPNLVWDCKYPNSVRLLFGLLTKPHRLIAYVKMHEDCIYMVKGLFSFYI